ncbi:hypothetical protein HYPSUDRAFT_44174 [Hypholoma sublateritium FD-334 SS-4]|uniref:Fungal lipase-type domain-containing protein n=1 Tax=Hypholoma sublateritium (strain FD-334 SS-4) TaxID=945553 RepID=A0A0D2M8I3_HYPSF|nr:hypothetical protein HYPSUDRAFT_44174 [Hypholoma sublateritium FD-334 SS-4]
MVFAAGILVTLLAGVAHISASPILESRQSVTAVSTTVVTSYKRYTYYASAAYCKPAATLAWSCGANCDANTGFTAIASGGDGSSTQYWYVGYDSALQSVIVGFQGTEVSKILPVVTDLTFALKSLDSTLFPGLSISIKTHDGFGDAHAKSATAVLAAVKTGLSKYATTKVSVVGHSLGGAIAIISTGYLSLNLPSTTTIKTVTYGAPRVGNEAFVTWVNALSDMTRINNKKDIVPIVPGRSLGFTVTENELHINSDNVWESCPGADNTDTNCIVGAVPNIFSGNTSDHMGPYDGVTIGC